MTVAEFFKGKNIFITGGSGFLGKLLIEKLLRSCPEIGNIYVLLRPKKGNSIEERLEKIKASVLFDSIKKDNTEVLEKIIAIKGDVCEINLGMDKSDRKMLIENVNIIYNAAASVRFDDYLKDAIITNVRGTRETVKLGLDLMHISLFVHVSSTYCNCDKLTVKEKIYPAHGDWRGAITLAEECGDDLLKTMSEKYIRPMPNTYTFTKLLGEHVVNDLCLNKVPSIIVRPSVMTNTEIDPIPGYNDNFNGPMGLMTACGKGMLRMLLCNVDATVDYIPVDYVIKLIILATHLNGVKNNLEEVEVYNASQNGVTSVTQGELISIGGKINKHWPFSSILWYPRTTITSCWYNYYIQVLLFHMLPAFLVDILLVLARKKSMLFNIQRKVYIANIVLKPFLFYSFSFVNKKMWDLQKLLKNEDSAFGHIQTAYSDKKLFDYFKQGKYGIARYLLKEKFDLIEGESESKNNLARYWYLDITVKTIFFSCLFWFVAIKINVTKLFFVGLETYFRSLY